MGGLVGGGAGPHFPAELLVAAEGSRMPGSARKDIVREGEIGVYHVWSKCAQDLYLCGKDWRTGEDFEHRRLWIKRLLEYLAGVFAVDVGNYTILSNHQHAILRTRPDIAATWTDEEVAWRWKLAWPRWTGDAWIREPTDEEIQKELAKPERLPQIRANLASLSWFMARWKEPIAKAANRESDKRGHFYAERFGSREIEDDPANLCCNIYLDLNQPKAGMADRLEDCNCSAIQDRLRAWRRMQAESSVEEFRATSTAAYELRVEDVENLLEDCRLSPIGDHYPLLLLGGADRPSMEGPPGEIIHLHSAEETASDAAEASELTRQEENPSEASALSGRAAEPSAAEPLAEGPARNQPLESISPASEAREAADSRDGSESANEGTSADPAGGDSSPGSSGPKSAAAQPTGRGKSRSCSRSQQQATHEIHKRLNPRRRCRASDNPILAIPREQYLGIVCWAAEQLKREDPEPPPKPWEGVLRSCGVNPAKFVEVVKRFGELFHGAVGHPAKLEEVCQRRGVKWLHGSRACRDAFT